MTESNPRRNLRISNLAIKAALEMLGIDPTRVHAFQANLTTVTVERHTGEILGLRPVKQIEQYEVITVDPNEPTAVHANLEALRAMQNDAEQRIIRRASKRRADRSA